PRPPTSVRSWWRWRLRKARSPSRTLNPVPDSPVETPEAEGGANTGRAPDGLVPVASDAVASGQVCYDFLRPSAAAEYPWATPARTDNAI
ncbi:MAG: hypothetical protein ACK58T_45620, partial [Phycisphaerae bacterium]